MHDPAQVLDVLRRRASTRGFAPSPIDEQTVAALLEAARWAPSWGNLQPWRLVLVREPAARAALARAFTPGNAWAAAAPLLIVVAADPRDSRARDEGYSYQLDCGLATAQLIVQAVASGLVAHPFGGWDEPAVRAAIDAPERTRIVIIVAVGHSAPEPETPGKPARPRERLPLSAIAFADRWGQPLPSSEPCGASDESGAPNTLAAP